MFSWIAEYLDGKVVCYDCHDRRWRTLPERGVLRVYVKMVGQAPFAKPGATYLVPLQGFDYYFVVRNADDSSVRFGGWSIEPGHEGGGLFTWTPKDWYTREPILSRPDGLDDSDIKEGVLVPEPLASSLGFTGAYPRTIPGCNDG